MVAQEMTVDQLEVPDFFATNNSLQDRFAAFRAKKLKEAATKSKKKDLPKTQQEKDALRQKWVQQCEKYIGVPYSKRYVEEGSAEWEKGILCERTGGRTFLDCCGLLRQASQDLKDEFGWCLGRWNQTYQFALCSAVIDEKDMKPGDLIFYEATYHDSSKKPQHWDITHIEVFVGPGRRTIGSRWKQHVGYHETFELGTEAFPSQLWTVKNFHFRSIEPWLEGVMPKFCIDQAEALFPTVQVTQKKSIFFVGDEDVEEAEVDMDMLD